MLGWIVRLVLVFLLLRAVSRLFRGIADGMSPARPLRVLRSMTHKVWPGFGFRPWIPSP